METIWKDISRAAGQVFWQWQVDTFSQLALSPPVIQKRIKGRRNRCPTDLFFRNDMLRSRGDVFHSVQMGIRGPHSSCQLLWSYFFSHAGWKSAPDKRGQVTPNGHLLELRKVEGNVYPKIIHLYYNIHVKWAHDSWLLVIAAEMTKSFVSTVRMSRLGYLW